MPAATGRLSMRVQAAALRHDQLDAVEEALVLRDRGIHHARELGDDVAARVAERRVRGDVRPRVRAREVDRQAIAVDGDLHVHDDVRVAERIVVDPRARLVDAVRPGRDLFAEAPARVVDGMIDGGTSAASAPYLATTSFEPPDAELRRADLRAEIADERRVPVIRLHHVNEVAPLDAPHRRL